MNVTIRASSSGLREIFGVIEGVTGVIGSVVVVVPAGAIVGARVATACGGVATDSASAGVTCCRGDLVTNSVRSYLVPAGYSKTGGAEVADAVRLLLKAPSDARVGDAGAVWLKLPSVLGRRWRRGTRCGGQRRPTAQITAPKGKE